MVAITALSGIALHAGGSAAQPAPAPKPTEQATATPATIVTLSDRARQLVAEAKAAERVGDIFALANGVAVSDGGDRPAKSQALIAHDIQANEGLYIVWSQTRR